jgi:deazaflavin-dependent oxidoreductase (nitroreductase family)
MMDMREHNRVVIEQFRAGGEVEGMHRDRILLLTTTGARTGREHTTPMMFVRDGERLLVIAANAGAQANPDWYRNVVANQDVTVEIGHDRYPATATPLAGEDLRLRWEMIKSSFPFFGDYEKQVSRTIPVVELVAHRVAG